MKRSAEFRPEKLEYLKLLAKQYPTVQSACTQIINLRAIKNLTNGTAHFQSAVHG
ncbi:MAG: fructose-bisphosphatase class III, partial [Oscillospiraceae bacterium]